MLRTFVDHDDRPDTIIRIGALTDRSAGVLVGHAAPAGCGVTLPQDLLLMLGHDVGAAGWPRAATSAWRLARAWMAGFEISHLIIYGAWRLRESDAMTLIQIAVDDGVDVSLVTLGQTRRLTQSLRSLSLLPIEDLFADTSRSIRPPDTSQRDCGRRLPNGLPPLPAADATCFQAECAGRIKDERLWLALADTFDAITADLRNALEGARTPDVVLEVLERQIRWARDSNDLIVAVRALQLAALRSHWLVQVSLRLLGLVAAMVLDTSPANHRSWPWTTDTDPMTQAMAALAWGTMSTAPDMAAATIGDIDSSCLSFKGQALDPAMAPPIRAQIWMQCNRGRGSGDPLLPTRNGGHHRPKAISDILDACQPTAFNATEVGPTALQRALRELVVIHRLRDDVDLSGATAVRRPLLPSAQYSDWTFAQGGESKLQLLSGLPRDADEPKVRDRNGYRRAIEHATGSPKPPRWPPNHGWATESEAPDHAADLARLHSVLLGAGGGADRHGLVRGLGWTLERLQDAETALRDQLRPTAEILAATLDGRLELRRKCDETTASAVETIQKRYNSDVGLSPAAARLLLQVIEGPRVKVSSVPLVGRERVTLSAMHELQDRGLVGVDGRGNLALRSGVAGSLHVLSRDIMPHSAACT